MNKIYKSKGITIIELIITLFVLSVGTVGILGAMRQPIEQAGISILTFRAYYFAQEGIETVRNERDKLWIRDENWDKNMLQITTNYLNIDPIPGTKFKREVILEEGDEEDIIKINVNISWTEKGKDYEINVQENLYNWL